MNFYALIIGTEILNARRNDKHFVFIRDELAKYGHELFASFIVKDDEELMKKSFELIKNDKKSVMFSFGGIGTTPDDLTRKISAEVFTKSQNLIRNKIFEKDILDRFGDEAYPHRIFMSDLPQNSNLLYNPVNNMSGYSLEDRFFFVPGFPQMAHPMLKDVIKKLFSTSKKKYRKILVAKTSENSLITLMNRLPKDIELSSLPMIDNGNVSVELSLSGYDEKSVTYNFQLFKDELNKENIQYTQSNII